MWVPHKFLFSSLNFSFFSLRKSYTTFLPFFFLFLLSISFWRLFFKTNLKIKKEFVFVRYCRVPVEGRRRFN